ncbi:hypothetical protein WHR41_06950 [Cladosporium halotolerans]|uniref:Uncharacterized protein n=1 Tax=Cladosporium halotolerans TaxID=1052096 RepID=A0AB34KKW6_9PEZI
MKLSAGLPTLFALLVASVSANTEKAIFTAPDAVTFTDSNPSLDVLQLESLALERSTLRTSLDVAAPGEAASGGVKDHWYLLRDLNPQQRYELRACWSASQPTNFWIDVYNINEVFDTPELIQTLAAYAEKPERKRPEPTSSPHTSKESVLFLRVRAAAEFYTTNKDLMLSPPPVDVDLILDPYVFNIFPKSLGPTALYIVVLAVCAWFVSGYVWKFIQPAASDKPHKE